MNEEQIRRIVTESVTEATVAWVVEKVLEKLADRQKMALVVFTGSTIGHDESLRQLAKLREQGFCFDVLMTYNAARLLDGENIKRAIEPGKLLQSTGEISPEEFAYPYPTIIVPALTAYSAAHIANLTPESPAVRAIIASMMRGKNVVTAIDGCDPDHPVRMQKGYRLTEGIKAKMRELVASVESYGATLATTENLADMTLKAIGQVPLPVEKPGTIRVASAVKGGVVSRADVANLPEGSVLRVTKDALITQLARDEATTKRIDIQRM